MCNLLFSWAGKVINKREDGAPCGSRTRVGHLGGNCSIQLS